MMCKVYVLIACKVHFPHLTKRSRQTANLGRVLEVSCKKRKPIRLLNYVLCGSML